MWNKMFYVGWRRCFGSLTILIVLLNSSACHQSRNGEEFLEDEYCMLNYDVSEDQIIRTKDSQALGAVYLNETDIGPKSRDECFRLCCKTPQCNVIVFEEKNSGSCYLFNCGTTEDFLCKFTAKDHYMSAILRKRHNHPVNQNQHENELSELRNMDDKQVNNHKDSLGEPSKRKGEETVGGGRSYVSPTTFSGLELMESSPRCNLRIQFQCKTSGECIAIYNACDGIPQCADKSDEFPELNCPSSSDNLPKPKGGPENGMKTKGFPEPVNLNSHQSFGEGLLKSEPHIFYHKDGGVMEPSDFGSQVQQQQQQANPYWKPNNYDYSSMGEGLSGGRGYGGPPMPPQVPNSGLIYGNGNNNNNYGNGPYSQFQPFQPPPLGSAGSLGGNLGSSQQQMQLPQQPYYPNNGLLNGNINSVGSSNFLGGPPRFSPNSPPRVDGLTTKSPPMTTAAAKGSLTGSEGPQIGLQTTGAPSPKVDDQLLKSLNLKIPFDAASLSSSYDGLPSVQSPGAGAVLAFIMGIGMSFVMVVIVGCKMCRSGSRRRGKNRLDPDYLVDGMYL